jgi:CrcB protein
VINVSGSFVLGLVTGLALHHGLPAQAVSLLGTGICGGYTTFSTFSVETVRLAEDGSYLEAGVNIGGSLVAGLLAAAAGLGLALVL